MDWLNFLGSTATGGILGLVGSLGAETLKFFNRRQEHRQKMDMLKLEAELIASKTAGSIAELRERGSAEAFAESQRAEGNIRGEHRWATTYRAITRPSLTHLGLVASIILAFWPPASEMGQTLAATVNAYTGMMIAWWFGQRAMDRSRVEFSGGSITGKVSTTSTK